MDMQGSRQLSVTQQQAWESLNDPDVLKACVPGCEKFERTGDNQYAVVTALRIGPVAARFTGRIQLSDVDPPRGYTLAFDGQGGPAGFGKGTAKVQLAPAPEGAGTALNYTVQAQVGGKIAQVGQRLIDGVAKSMADDFFKRFDEEMARRHPAPDAGQAPAPAPAAQASSGTPGWVWVVGGLVVVALAWLLLRR
jgi:carbon monoxide dehydrogenase subunit G